MVFIIGIVICVVFLLGWWLGSFLGEIIVNYQIKRIEDE